jgi:hypothetical protein
METLVELHRHRQQTTASSVAEPEQSHTDLLAAARAQWHHHKAIQLAFALALEEDILHKPAVVLLANTAATEATHTEVESGAESDADLGLLAPSLSLHPGPLIYC